MLVAVVVVVVARLVRTERKSRSRAAAAAAAAATATADGVVFRRVVSFMEVGREVYRFEAWMHFCMRQQSSNPACEGTGTNVVDRMCCCNLLLKANGMATAMLRRVAWVPGACGRFLFGGKQTSKQAKLKRRQQGKSKAKRI